MGAGMRYHVMIWRSLPASILLYGATFVHAGLGLYALYARREFHRTALEPLQLLLGLSIPLLLMSHVVSIRLGDALFEHAKFYPQAFHAYWVSSPWRMWLMFVALLAAWGHGCLGLQMWLRIKPWFKHIAPLLLALAVLIPALALLGLYQGGRTVVAESASEEWRQQNLSEFLLGTPAEQTTLDRITEAMLLGYLALIALAIAGRGLRTLYERRGGTIRLNYGNGRVVRVPRGLSVLEASLRHKVPHASACGGRARCSTCRIRVIGDTAHLPEPTGRESIMLSRNGAGVDPAVRLACQLRPAADISFVQIFTPSAVVQQRTTTRGRGQERFLVSLFVDMRGSTRLAESRLPFDTVFIVNRFLSAIAKAVIACGGEPNQFIGDGQLALFGLGCDPPTACRQALQAVAAIAANIDELNQFLRDDLREPIGFGIGIHGGEVIVGDVGYLDHIVFTALGDSVNVAARLQDMTKTLGCEVVVSQQVCDIAGVAADRLARHDLAIRGRNEPMPVRVAIRAHEFEALLSGKTKSIV
jgi:adenylate cyclase